MTFRAIVRMQQPVDALKSNGKLDGGRKLPSQFHGERQTIRYREKAVAYPRVTMNFFVECSYGQGVLIDRARVGYSPTP